MPAQFDLFAPPALPAASEQLSLFAEDAEAGASEAGSSPGAGKKPRKRAAKARNARVRESGTPFTLRLFDDHDAAKAAPQVREVVGEIPSPAPVLIPLPPARIVRVAKDASPALPPLTLPFGDDGDAEETGEPSYRVLFDSTVWALRPDSGDFIHVGTGEVRDEESFTFPTDLRGDYADTPDEWDMPQVRP